MTRTLVNYTQSKLLVGIMALLLLVGCQSSERRNAYERGRLDIAAEQYGWLLPEVDSVEIYTLRSGVASATNGFPTRVGALRGVSFYPIVRQKTIVKHEAQDLRKKWRAMTFWWGFSALCHEPAYGLRFYNGRSLALETTFCWKCSNFEVPTPHGYRFMGFDAKKPEAQSLFALLQEHLPLPEEGNDVHR